MATTQVATVDDDDDDNGYEDLPTPTNRQPFFNRVTKVTSAEYAAAAKKTQWAKRKADTSIPKPAPTLGKYFPDNASLRDCVGELVFLRQRQIIAPSLVADAVSSSSSQDSKYDDKKEIKSKPTICAVGIVLREHTIVRRMIESLARFCTHVLLCYTGKYSNAHLKDTKADDEKEIDPTANEIEKAMEEFNLGGAIYWVPFVDFGRTRTVSVQLAMQHKFADYSLLTDADYVWKYGDDEKWVDDLTADCYQVQTEGDMLYWRPHLVKTTVDVKYAGRTHEALHVPHTARTARLPQLQINHIGDGGSKKDKLPRDEYLLFLDLADKPEDVRSLFYLSQTYWGWRKFERAIAFAQRRIDGGDFDEEVYISYYTIGRCYKELSGGIMTPTALKFLLEAFLYRPHRLEALFEVVAYFRNKHHKLATALGSFATFNKFPTNDSLFIEKAKHDYLFWFELSITASYCPEYTALSHWTHNKLLEMTKQYPHIKEQLMKNLKMHMNRLQSEMGEYLSEVKFRHGTTNPKDVEKHVLSSQPHEWKRMLTQLREAQFVMNNSLSDPEKRGKATKSLQTLVGAWPTGWFAARESIRRIAKKSVASSLSSKTTELVSSSSSTAVIEAVSSSSTAVAEISLHKPTAETERKEKKKVEETTCETLLYMDYLTQFCNGKPIASEPCMNHADGLKSVNYDSLDFLVMKNVRWTAQMYLADTKKKRAMEERESARKKTFQEHLPVETWDSFYSYLGDYVDACKLGKDSFLSISSETGGGRTESMSAARLYSACHDVGADILFPVLWKLTQMHTWSPFPIDAMINKLESSLESTVNMFRKPSSRPSST